MASPLALLLLAVVQDPAPAQPEVLTDLSLEELMDLEVTIASRTEQRLFDAPAAVYVITGEEIRRSGHTSIQEALRMVPGFQVARWGSHEWAVTARGFSGAFSNQLLVMIDGVSVYTPLFAGVWWHLQDVDLSDVDRIEIIRGPGATLWGANAVNGIVNVITKHAKDTQGLQSTAVAGTEERSFAQRYGGRLGEYGWFRTWAKWAEHTPMVDSSGVEADEDWWGLKGGFRADWDFPDGDRLKVSANAWFVSIEEQYFITDLGPTFTTPVSDETPKTGTMWMADWEHRVSADVVSHFQGWYQRDHYKQVDFFSTIDILDLEFQQSRRVNDGVSALWGLGYHLVASDLEGDFTFTFDPEERNDQTVRGFAQGELAFFDRALRLTAGAQIEHNDLTGFEFQPNARGIWNPTPSQAVWAAWSRAVRTPSLEENGVDYLISLDDMGTFLELLGSDEFDSEEQVAWELGYRREFGPTFEMDLTAFYYEYDNLQTFEDGTPFSVGPSLFLPVFFDNKASARSWGAEAALDWDVNERWRLRSAYSYFQIESEVDADSTEVTFPETDGSSPKNQANLRSYYDLGDQWELDGGLYYVDSLPYWDNPSYLRVDLRLGYNPSEVLSLSLGVQNLCDPQHPEQGPGNGFGSEVERNLYFGLTWRP